MEKEQILDEIYEGVLDGDQDKVFERVKEGLEAEIDPFEILNDAMIAAMDEVGNLFEAGEYFVPEMLVAARAMKKGLTLLRPILAKTDVEPVGKVLLGTVKGDMHDIGKNLVSMMLEGAGFEVDDLGIDVSAEKFVEVIREGDYDILGMSALLTTTMPYMKVTIEAMVEAGLRDRIIILVGGAPITEEFARQVGADGYAPDAGQAAKLAKKLMNLS